MRRFLVRCVDELGRHELTVLAACSVDALLFVLGEFPAARRISSRPA